MKTLFGSGTAKVVKAKDVVRTETIDEATDNVGQEDASPYFAKGHREGYRRGGHVFSATAALFPGEPSEVQKRDRYIVWYKNTKGEPGVLVSFPTTPSLDDLDEVRRKADAELREKLKAARSKE